MKEGIFMDKKSLLDYGFDVLSESKEPIKFRDLFFKTIELAGLELSEEDIKRKMSKFYTQLSIDERFIILAENYWDLSSRHVFKQIHTDDYAGADDEEENDDIEEERALAQERGEQIEEPDSDESDEDLDFDKPNADPDDGDDEF